MPVPEIADAKPEAVGLSSSRLGRIEDALKREVEAGLLPGAEALVELAIQLADDWRVPLRLMSLLAVGKERSEDARHELHAIAERHVHDLVAQANDVLPDDFPVTGVLGTGRSLEECVHGLDFDSSEIVMVGSSRLGGPKRLFLGASANTILHALGLWCVVKQSTCGRRRSVRHLRRALAAN